MPFLVVPEEVVKRSITAEECTQAMEEGFRLLADGEISDSFAELRTAEDGTSINLYASHVPQSGAGVKILSVCPKNPARQEPYIRAVVTLLDPDTGELEALVDGSYLTGLRTGAATAIGAQELCRKDSQVLGILGTGLQARTHLLCHLVVHPFQRVVIWGRNRALVEEYLAEMRPQVKVPLQVLPSADAVCAEADVVACATSASSPLFTVEAVRPGTHFGVVAPMGSHYSEIPLALLGGSRLFVDTRKKFLGHWEPGAQPTVQAELAEVVAGSARGRIKAEDITIFKPEGMAFEDVVSARIVVDRVRREKSCQTIAW